MEAQNSKPGSKDRTLEERTKALFQESVANLDGPTRSKLTQARYRALAELQAPSRAAWRWSWAPAGAIAAVALATWMLWSGQPPVEETFDVAAATDLEILLSEEELDMLQELEFYAWLEDQAELSGPNGAEDVIG